MPTVAPPGPIRSSGRRPAADCAAGTHPGRSPAARPPRRVLQVDSDRTPAAADDEIDRGLAVHVVAYVVGPVYPDHLGAHVAEHHRAPRAGTDRRDLDDLHTLERAHLSSA